MLLLPMVERELRVAARQRKTYWARAATAGAFVLVLAGLFWLGSGVGSFNAREIFQFNSWLLFASCLLAGPLLASDAISREQRENTLGLLFLTDLRGPDIALGKLASTSLETVLGLLGVLPVLAIPILMGGVSLSEFGAVALSLLNTLFFSLSTSLLVSTLTPDGWRALGGAVVILAGFTLGTLLLADLLEDHYKLTRLAEVVGWFNLGNMHQWAVSSRWARANFFGHSLLATHLTAQSFLVLTCLLLPRAWREGAPRAREFFLRRWARSWRGWDLRQTPSGRAARARLIDRAAWAWVAARERTGGVGWLLLVVVGVGLTMIFFSKVIAPNVSGRSEPLQSLMITWLLISASVHGLLLLQVTLNAARPLVEARATGALELVLSTPLRVRALMTGHWAALAWRSFGLVLAALFAHALFLWLMLMVFGIEEFDGAGPVETLRRVAHAFSDRTGEVPTHYKIIFTLPVMMSVVSALHAWALGWVSAWLAVRLKSPRMAPWAALALVIVPPWLAFIALIQPLAQMRFMWRGDEVFWIAARLAFGLNGVNDLALGIWAWYRLATRLRRTVAEGFRRAPGWPWLLRPRVLGRFAAAVVLLGALVWTWSRIEGRRGDRAWRAVEAEAVARGETLEFDSMLLPPVPPELDMAQTTFWKPVADFVAKADGRQPPPQVTRINAVSSSFNQSRPGPTGRWQGRPALGSWDANRRTDFLEWETHFRGQTNLIFASPRHAQEPARDVLEALENFDDVLDALHEASARPYTRFPTDPRSRGFMGYHMQFIHPLIDMLHLRAVARVAEGQTGLALEDIHAVLNLGHTLGAEPYFWTVGYAYGLRMPAVSAIWEGLATSCWSVADLAELQVALSQIDLPGQFRAIVRAETLMRIEQWDALLPGSRHASWHNLWDANQLAFMKTVYPRGWIQQHKARLLRELPALESLIDRENQRLADPPAGSGGARMRRGPMENSGPELEGTLASMARAQAAVHFAMLGCALERFRIERGPYPERLEELVPAFIARIPRDIFTGEPLRYRRDADGRFSLSVVGKRGSDGGGQTRPRVNWSWKYPDSNPASPLK